MNSQLRFAIASSVLIVAFVGSAFADDSATEKTVGYYMKTQTAPEWKNWLGGTVRVNKNETHGVKV